MLTAAAVVVCALDLLGRSQSIAPIRVLPSPPPTASRNVEAFVGHDPPAIYLIESSDVFRTAEVNDRDRRDACRKLASIIVHEEWHLRHGPDEQGAYFAQLTMLSALGAGSDVIAEVRKSMFAVLRTARPR